MNLIGTLMCWSAGFTVQLARPGLYHYLDRLYNSSTIVFPGTLCLRVQGKCESIEVVAIRDYHEISDS